MPSGTTPLIMRTSSKLEREVIFRDADDSSESASKNSVPRRLRSRHVMFTP